MNISKNEESPPKDAPRKPNKWQYLAAILAFAFTVGLGVFMVINWDAVYGLAGYGYVGGFVISALGGASILIPVPMLAVQFALGGIIKPLAGPDALGPVFVGVICAGGETIGALSIYLTGIGGSAPFSVKRGGRLKRIGEKFTALLERRGQLTLFLLSAIMNPFFYPASLALGASRFGIKRFGIIVFAGKTIKCSLIAYAGYLGFRGIFRLFGIDV